MTDFELARALVLLLLAVPVCAAGLWAAMTMGRDDE